MRIYSKMENEVKRYKAALERYQKHGDEKVPDTESIRERLQKMKVESQNRNRGIKKQKNYTRGRSSSDRYRKESDGYVM